MAYDANLGTLLRTCDAIGACLAAPRTRHYRHALRIGDTLRRQRPCIQWVAPSKEQWVAEQRELGKRIVAVELADDAVALPRLAPARRSTVLLLATSSTWPEATSMPSVYASSLVRVSR